MGSRRALVVASLIAAACGGAYGADDPDPAPTCNPACGPHGRCDSTTCTCEPGYSGADCTACATNFVSSNGACVSPCTGKDCGPHATCTVQGADAVCTCTPQYAIGGQPDGGDPTHCSWSGGPLDPGFQGTPPNAWSLDGGAELVAFDGGIDPGMVAYKKFNGIARQTFPVPPYAQAEPLALDVAIVCQEFGHAANDCNNAFMQLGFNNRFINRFLYQPVAQHICLGERAFGRDVSLELGVRNFEYGSMTVGIDRAAINPAPDCPPLGAIPNPKFEDVGGWSAYGPNTEISVNAGTNGSRAGHLHLAKRCDGASLTGTISIPDTSLVSPALRMTVHGNSGQHMYVQILGSTLAIATGSGVFESQTVCLPQWSRGLAGSLAFSLSGGTGVCGDVLDQDFIIDDLEIVSDATMCPDTAAVVDGGFERSSSKLSSWTADLQADSTFGYTTNNPHSGKSAGYVDGGAQCASSTVSQALSVPDRAPGKGGPQLRYWYRTTGTNVQILSPIGDVKASAWTLATLCIDPNQAGHAYGFSIGLQSGGTGCSYPAVYVDDVDIVHDPSCPE